MRAIRTATINHNNADWMPRGQRRLKLVLEKDDAGLIWRTADGEDCCIAPQPTVAAAVEAARISWGAPVWCLRASWVEH